ncbi:unnamed protein product [Caenorhabditis sp. 36 PRJEB53466]|nr:unnamed protein product [Caenorhabditis sp. 36 PRJEB53466]
MQIYDRVWFHDGSHQTPTIFYFNTTLICRDPHTKAPIGEWCYQVKYFEEDMLKSDDLIAQTEYVCTEDIAVKFVIDGFQSGDWASWNYDIYSQITHTCNFESVKKSRERPFSKIPVDGRTVYTLHHTVELYESGT